MGVTGRARAGSCWGGLRCEVWSSARSIACRRGLWVRVRVFAICGLSARVVLAAVGWPECSPL